jgi:hypothetical protein
MSRVGPNADTMKIAGDLAANRLADLRLIAALRPHADFVLASTPQPDSSRTKTWIDAQRRGKDLLPLRRLSDLPRATILQPGKSRRDNFREGTAFTRTKRKAGTEVVGKANESAQRVTVLLVDQSGSTKDLERFIRTLVSTFAANALSDLAPNGQPRHKVLIIPYGDETYPEIPVTSVSQAVEMIHSRKRRFYARNAGTNTQQAIIAALRRIKQAQDEASEPLALANVVVVTDGYCTIDTDELKTERDKIDRKTPVQAMFVAIEGQNAALAEFAESSQSAGLSRGFYRHFSGLEIAKLEKQADHYDSAQLQAEGRTYYTERGWNDVPAGYFERLRTARAAAGRLEQEIAEDRRVATAETMLRTLRRPRHDADDRSGNETPGPWTQEVRHLLKGSLAFADRTLARRVTGDLFQHYGRLTGRQLDDLGPHARLELETLIEESTQPQRRGGP